MKDVMILTGISLQERKSTGRKALKGLMNAIKTTALSGVTLVRRHPLTIAVATGVTGFFAIMLGCERFGSVLAIVSMLTLWMSEEGGEK